MHTLVGRAGRGTKIHTHPQPKSQRWLNCCRSGTAKSALALEAASTTSHQSIGYAGMLLSGMANPFLEWTGGTSEREL